MPRHRRKIERILALYLGISTVHPLNPWRVYILISHTRDRDSDKDSTFTRSSYWSNSTPKRLSEHNHRTETEDRQIRPHWYRMVLQDMTARPQASLRISSLPGFQTTSRDLISWSRIGRTYSCRQFERASWLHRWTRTFSSLLRLWVVDSEHTFIDGISRPTAFTRTWDHRHRQNACESQENYSKEHFHGEYARNWCFSLRSLLLLGGTLYRVQMDHLWSSYLLTVSSFKNRCLHQGILSLKRHVVCTIFPK